MSKGWTKKQVANLIDIKPSTIQVYVDRGLVVPEVDNPTGKGTRRRYSKRNLLEFLLIKKLGRYGLSLARIERILDSFRTAVAVASELPADAKEAPEEARETLWAFRVFWDLSNLGSREPTFLFVYNPGSEDGSTLSDAEVVDFVHGDARKTHISHTFPKSLDGVLIVNVSDIMQTVAAIQ